jgi:tRNA(Arg) A34 adenosine deaminase TadA
MRPNKAIKLAGGLLRFGGQAFCMDDSDLEHLRATIRTAEQVFLHGNHPFGASLVIDGRAVLSAENSVHTDNDPTRHAELKLVSMAAKRLNLAQIGQATLYSSTEPCPMCAGAIYQCRIPRLVYGCSGEGLRRLTGTGRSLPCREVFERVGRRVAVAGPLLEEEGLDQHERLAWWVT